MENFIQSVKDTFTDIREWWGHFFDWCVQQLLDPVTNYIKSIDAPCASCFDAFDGSANFLMTNDWSSSLGFDALHLFVYFASFLNVSFGLEVVFTAVLAKFILRRLPFIG